LPDTQLAKQANAEGGNEVSENTEAVATVEETVVAAEETTPVAEAPAEAVAVEAEAPAAEAAEAPAEDAPAETLEKAADVSEVEVNAEPDFAKMLGELKGFFSDTLNKASESNAAQVASIKETVETFSKSVDTRISELAEQHTALSNAVNEVKSTLSGVQKRVDAVEAETAIKKSSDLGRSEEVTIKKSKWNGSFLGSVNEIFN